MFYRNTQPLSCLTFVLCVFRRLFYLPPHPQEDPKTKHQTSHRPTQGTQAKTTHAANNFPAKKQPENSPKTAKNIHDPSHPPTPFSCYLNKIPASHWSGRWHSGSRASSKGGLRIFQVYKKGRIIFSLITNKKLLDPCPPLSPSHSLPLFRVTSWAFTFARGEGVAY